MVMQIGGWTLDVDVALNMQITSAQAEDHCTCGYCRNFYETIDSSCPSLRPFLAKLGVHVDGPDELSPFEPTIYEASYIVNGKILKRSEQKLYIDGVPVKIVDAVHADMDTIRPEPYFVLVIGLIELPWVLDEDPSQVVSPANEEQYLQRMQRKLMSRAAEDICS